MQETTADLFYPFRPVDSDSVASDSASSDSLSDLGAYAPRSLTTFRPTSGKAPGPTRAHTTLHADKAGGAGPLHHHHHHGAERAHTTLGALAAAAAARARAAAAAASSGGGGGGVWAFDVAFRGAFSWDCTMGRADGPRAAMTFRRPHAGGALFFGGRCHEVVRETGVNEWAVHAPPPVASVASHPVSRPGSSSTTSTSTETSTPRQAPAGAPAASWRPKPTTTSSFSAAAARSKTTKASSPSQPAGAVVARARTTGPRGDGPVVVALDGQHFLLSRAAPAPRGGGGEFAVARVVAGTQNGKLPRRGEQVGFVKFARKFRRKEARVVFNKDLPELLPVFGFWLACVLERVGR